uniref:Uncharacterized protein n=1 Tax=Romanomermis culicivorax TaxID=13658 RepID=A0A915L5F4_ROMCU
DKSGKSPKPTAKAAQKGPDALKTKPESKKPSTSQQYEPHCSRVMPQCFIKPQPAQPPLLTEREYTPQPSA